MSASPYLSIRGRFWPGLFVITCGLVLGYFVVRTFVYPLPPQYQLDFGGAKWIGPPQFSATAYFRKKIYLSSAPEHAWLQVSAPDSYRLFVNNHMVGGRRKSLKTRIVGAYDITGLLSPGTNVIAVEVERITYPGTADLLVAGAVTEPGGQAVPFVSDGEWKVTVATGITSSFQDWTSRRLNDEVWPHAKVMDDAEQKVRLNWSSTNPLLVQRRPLGRWIMAGDGRRAASFSTTVEADREGEATWIQTASAGLLDILVNGKLVSSATNARSHKHQPRLPVALATPTPAPTVIPLAPPTISPSDMPQAKTTNLAAYDISQWIKKGRNTIVGAVRNDPAPASLFLTGFFTRSNGEIKRFATDSSWQVVTPPSRSGGAERVATTEAGESGSPPWGYLVQARANSAYPTDFRSAAAGTVVILLVILAVFFCWLLAGNLLAELTGKPRELFLIRDALFHLPVLWALLFIFLCDYDFRFPNTWSFQPRFVLGAIFVLLAMRFLHLLPAATASKPFQRRVAQLRQLNFAQLLPYILLAAIMGLGFFLRYHDLAFMSFDHDEMGMVIKSKGVLVRGYPYYEYRGIVNPATTYEAVPYFDALSGWLFGYSEWSMRLPNCLLGTLCIPIIILFGRRLFNWRVGLLAGLCYACMTVDIRWAQNVFHPQQCQFFTMLVIAFFYEAVRVRPFHQGYLTAASVAFAFEFLSWEGSGFILPALAIALMLMRWREWWWLKEFHLYRCVFFMGVLVVAQFCWRTLSVDPYRTIGSGLSDLAGPSLFFLTTTYEALFYVAKFLFVENHVTLTLMLIIGIPLCWRQPAFRYVLGIFVTLLVLYTNFIAAISSRYFVFYHPVLLLGASAAAVTLYDRIKALVHLEGNSLIGRFVGQVAGVGLIALFFIPTNEWLLKDYYLSWEGDSPGLMNRMHTYRYDYRGAGEFVKEHAQAGDAIVPAIPHIFEWYSGLTGDFFLNSLLSKKITYDSTLPEPAFINKFRGYPALRSLDELLEVTHRYKRIWVIDAPTGSRLKLGSSEVIKYLDANAKALFESYRAKVYLIEGANQPENTNAVPSS